MKVELTNAEIQTAITALRILRAQQQALGAALHPLVEDQMRTAVRFVTDLETKLVAAKKELSKQKGQ